MSSGKPARRLRRLIFAAATLVALGVLIRRAILPGPLPEFVAVTLAPREGELAPRRAFVASMDTKFCDVALSPDGTTIYANLEIGAINVWSLLASCWPEIVAFALGALCALVLWRLLRPRIQPDAPYCRGCNYSLVHCASDRCPECGLELTPRNRAPARQRRWRAAILAVVAGVLVATCWLRMGFLSRGAWSDRFIWPSPILFNWAWHGGSWLQQLAVAHGVAIYRVVEIDASSGCIRATTRGHSKLALSQDGSLLAFLDGSTLCLWDVRAGRLRHRLRASVLGIPDVLAFAVSSDGRIVWVADAGSTVLRIDATTGKVLDRAAIGDTTRDLLIFDRTDGPDPKSGNWLSTSRDLRLAVMTWWDLRGAVTGVYGTEPSAPLALLSAAQTIWNRFAFAADARTLAVGGFRRGVDRDESIVAVYDLGQLPEAPPVPDAPGE